MDLRSLGLNSTFDESLDSDRLHEYRLARVVAVDKDSFIVKGDSGEARAEITGKLQYAAASPLDYPTVGDWVYVQNFDNDSFAVIHDIVPRKTLLRRKTPGRKIDFQLIAANIDTAFIIQSMDANFNPMRLERYMVAVSESGITPVILLSKCDLLSHEEIQEKLSLVRDRMKGVRVAGFSNLDERGVETVRSLLNKGETFCMLGSSGVGKTTLINKLTGREEFATDSIREKDGKGRHTTTRRQLTVLSTGEILVDTPGMRELGVFDAEAGIESTFDEIVALARECRYADCLHTSEEGCAVLAALADGTIPEQRYANFIKMTRESEYYSMSYRQKRSKDKAFGKMVKSVKKTMRKK